jgi:hypothetical protein
MNISKEYEAYKRIVELLDVSELVIRQVCDWFQERTNDEWLWYHERSSRIHITVALAGCGETVDINITMEDVINQRFLYRLLRDMSGLVDKWQAAHGEAEIFKI